MNSCDGFKRKSSACREGFLPTHALAACLWRPGSRFWVQQVFFNGETVVFKRGTEEQNCVGLELTAQ